MPQTPKSRPGPGGQTRPADDQARSRAIASRAPHASTQTGHRTFATTQSRYRLSNLPNGTSTQSANQKACPTSYAGHYRNTSTIPAACPGIAS